MKDTKRSVLSFRKKYHGSLGSAVRTTKSPEGKTIVDLPSGKGMRYVPLMGARPDLFSPSCADLLVTTVLQAQRPISMHTQQIVLNVLICLLFNEPFGSFLYEHLLDRFFAMSTVVFGYSATISLFREIDNIIIAI